MSKSKIRLASALLLVAAMGALGTALSAAEPMQTVFTAEQAAAGERAYNTQCAMCHGVELHGPNAPALIGAEVMQNFDTVAGLYTYTAAAMPPQAPGRLARQDYVNIMAYILKANGARAGSKPLTADTELMKRMMLASITAGHGDKASSAPTLPSQPADEVPQAYTWGKTLPSVK
jgi:mono/diheme cytochrome c family protein